MWVWWAPLAAASLHIAEEFAWPGGFGEWDRAYRPAIRRSITPRLHVVVNTLLLFLCASVWLAGMGPEGVVLGGLRFRSFVPPALAAASWVALAGLLGGNAVFHAVGTLRTRRYSPGLVTGLTAYLPLATLGTRHFVMAGQVSFLGALAWLAAGASYQLWATLGHRIRSRGGNEIG